jgi:SAM-dependent methyltransferase
VSIDFDGIKQGQRMMWSAGDYPDLAQHIAGVGEELAHCAVSRPDIELLDVATGSGNVAIPAALAGAQVTGLDLTPRLLEAARRRAAEAGVEVRFIEGDAEQLPFPADSFDAVTSCFGVMFAPRQELAAAELARVARPGSRIAVTAWTPEGVNGAMFRVVSSYMPPPPPELRSPTMWGNEDHVRGLFAPTGAELTFERRNATFSDDSIESWLTYNERVLGPTILAKQALEPQGRWEQLRGELADLYANADEADDGSFRFSAEYLLSIATMPAA